MHAPAAHGGCESGDELRIRDTLYFGRDIPGGETVSDAEWQAFLAEVVTPAFPEGLTVAQANGQWRGADGRIQTEPSTVVTLLHAGDAASRSRIASITDVYKQRFRQEAVLRERSRVCVVW